MTDEPSASFDVLLCRLHREWGNNVRAARGTYWRQRDLARVCGITGGALCHIERGRSVPSDAVKVRLAGALMRPVGDLFPWPVEVPPFPICAAPVGAVSVPA